MSKKLILTKSQERAFIQLISFINSSEYSVFILNGYAGTGKTTLMRLFIDELNKTNTQYSLLASTGRAAKILSNIVGTEAKTVHSKIYTYNDFNQDIASIVEKRERSGIDDTGQLLLQFTLNPISNCDNTIYYIVDEASMISDEVDTSVSQALFGSGRLLKDLFDYDKNGKFIFVGDLCQLPPIKQSFSPSLSVEYLTRNYNCKATEVDLTDIARQSPDNDIIIASKRVRELYKSPPIVKWGKFPLKNYKNIKLFPDQVTLISDYISKIKGSKYESSTFICYSNKSCNTFNSIIRSLLGFSSSSIQVGDLLLITQNNYPTGLMNGDMVLVQEVGFKEMRAQLTFINVNVKELFSQKTYSLLLIAEILYSDQVNLSQTQQKELFIDFYKRMKKEGYRQKDPFFKQSMQSDPYINALRAVYGYALTCHKAQGGEWDNVYLDIPKKMAHLPKKDTYQWLYTAMTRAKKQLNTIDGFWIG